MVLVKSFCNCVLFMLGFRKSLHLFYCFMLYINDASILFNIAIHADDSTVYSKCTSDLMQQLELVFLLECFINLKVRKTELVTFDCSNNSDDVIDVKMNETILNESTSF